jgi:hypothetical protein
MAFDPTKPVQTRDGHAARVLAMDIKHPDFTIVAAVSCGDNYEVVGQYLRDGRATAGGPIGRDLVNIPQKYVVWVNVYRHGGSGRLHGEFFASREQADGDAALQLIRRIACFDLEISEGEGL